MMTYYFELMMTPANSLANCLAAVGDKTVRRDQMAVVYEDLILACHAGGNEFGIVNRAIVQRWSPYALNRIKRLAWKRVQPKGKP